MWPRVAPYPKSGRTVTVVVAAANSSLKTKRDADYICDGVDDQVEIQAAIDALPADGGKVVLNEGTFNITTAINMASSTKRIHLCGQGQSTIINNTNVVGGHGISAINTAGSPGIRYGVLISNLTVKGVSGSGDGIHIEYADCPVIRNVYAIGNGRYGIYITQNAVSGFEGNSLIVGNYVLDNALDGIYIDTGVHEAFIFHNHIENNGRYGVCSYLGNFNVNIISNNIEDNASSAIYINDASALLIANNALEGTGDGVIQIAGSAYGRIVIVGNQIETATRGIWFTNTAVITNVSITGNTFSQLSGSSATINYVGGLSIVGNTSQYVGSTSVGGFYLINCDRVTISGNSIQSKSAGVSMASVNNAVVSNNVLETEYVGTNPNDRANVRLYNSANVIIESNVMKRKGGTPLAENIYIHGTLTGSRISGNNFSEATVAIATIEADTKVQNNIGYITENSGIATITAGQTLVDVTHGLAATPTRVQLTPTTDTAGKRYWVSTKGATTFTITIDSAHTANISFDWRAVVGEGN